ncbi:MAG: hypothetical protein KJ944_00055 [Alphaproteobacteria bacterium]|nr:hypothetical protein [Alphaproteobacteria bacterium]MBU1561551.1 hypothetical protein [Alphaproteobacteria bacterium]MBU2300966.1 hypothetical protein [Alphaproteobacteria bacterium]MBU2367248.1 hypothetical protein [Alphaproteobacteria bacterium]
MTTFLINETVDAQLCVDHGYPNPETDPYGWIEKISANVAFQIQEFARDLDWAEDMMRIAIARANYIPPLPLSAIEMEILEELAA